MVATTILYTLGLARLITRNDNKPHRHMPFTSFTSELWPSALDSGKLLKAQRQPMFTKEVHPHMRSLKVEPTHLGSGTEVLQLPQGSV